jgi:hypothetical protein
VKQTSRASKANRCGGVVFADAFVLSLPTKFVIAGNIADSYVLEVIARQIVATV